MPDWRCTYRLQLMPAFGFRDAREVAVPYVAELGASHLYLSPSLQARHGSLHGYDVTDPTRISSDLGGEDEFRSLCSAAHDAGLGILLDIVPNHMATSDEENPFWRDRALRARFFDWDPATGWYRRFFDVGDLAGVRVEDPDVFEATHAKVLDLIHDGLVDGLRVDHPDGLANPREYLDRLGDHGAQRVWVEKILEPGEELRDWPVQGTTGYEFANDVTALFIDPAAEEPMTALYQELTGERRTFAEIADEAKLEVARTTFTQEFDRLRTLYLHDALEDAAAGLHVYRTYVEPHGNRVAPEDRSANAPLPQDLRDVVELRGERSPQGDEFVTRWQQTTGPVMAKGVEDTAFYRYYRLTALNEVGGDPGRFSVDPATFHAHAQARHERHPLWLLASQTHDTKRAGDVRARIGALAGMHDRWADRIRTWRDITGGMEDPNDEYLVWQTLVGAWPIIPTRLEQYLTKALREAKRHTNWIKPNDEYERRVMQFVRSLYENQEFLDEFEPFLQDVAAAGEHASLGALLLRLTSPGLPDLYQGDEFWSLNLVDPDNRRPIDWRRRYRARDRAGPTRETMKFHLVRRVLRVRATHADAFAGTYEPLDLGPNRVGFIRGGRIRVVVPLRPGDSATSDGDLLLEFPQELSLLR